MELLTTNILRSLLLPPGGILLFLLLGLMLLRFRPLLAKTVLWSGLLIGYLLSTPYVEGIMMEQLQIYSAITPSHIGEQVKQSKASAIVVLSANSYKNAPEYGHDTAGEATLARVRYGAYLYRKTVLGAGTAPRLSR
jgi:uncharacterized SAM-binding protein YcdF (DUF218 family)